MTDLLALLLIVAPPAAVMLTCRRLNKRLDAEAGHSTSASTTAQEQA